MIALQVLHSCGVVLGDVEYQPSLQRDTGDDTGGRPIRVQGQRSLKMQPRQACVPSGSISGRRPVSNVARTREGTQAASTCRNLQRLFAQRSLRVAPCGELAARTLVQL